MTDLMTRAKTLFDQGAHLGHRKSRVHPRARQYIYQIADGVSLIDLEKTIAQIDTAKKVIAGASESGKKLLVVATKRAVAPKAAELASQVGAYSITTKWLPGLVTNFNTISKNVQKLIELKRQRDAGEWSKYVKHEQVALQKQIRKLERLYSGIVSMTRIPDLILAVDIKREKNAVLEARSSRIPVIAIVDTNSNPDEVEYPIMLNDDAPLAVESVLSEVLALCKQATAGVSTTTPPQESAAPVPVEDTKAQEPDLSVKKPKKSPAKKAPRAKKSK